MSTEIRQLTKEGTPFYPQTHVEAIVGNNGFGVDSEPTAGSDNLIKSGGVYLKINQEKQRAETSEQNLQENINSVKEETLEENRQMVNSIMENYAPVEITGNVNNAADEEDFTSVNVEGTDVLKFKDKVYNPLVYSGMGRKILRKNIVDGVNTLTQSMMQATNTIYVIQYDFTLGGNITIPANCVLKFEGGSLSNGRLIGNIKNSYLNVADFTKNNNITDAIRMILPLTDVYIPKGDWIITETINTGELIGNSILGNGKFKRRIFGEGLLSCVTLQNSSQFYIYDTWNLEISNLYIKFAITNPNYAIRLAGKNRYITISDINIEAEQWGNQNIQGSGIHIENPELPEEADATGNVYCTFKRINIRYVVNGININMDVRRTKDYITSSLFDDIHIDAFKNIAFAIYGIRCYTCTFTKLTISDNWNTGDDKYGILFGGHTNTFNDVEIWADNKGNAHEFYALWFPNETQVQGPSMFRGYVEGEIGGSDSNWITFFNRLNYDFSFYRISSIDRTVKHYATQVSNIRDTGLFYSIVDKNDVRGENFIVSPNSANGVSGSIENGYPQFTVEGENEANFEIMLTTNVARLLTGYKYRIFAKVEITKTDSTTEGRFRIRLRNGSYNSGTLVSNLDITQAYSNKIVNSGVNNGGTPEVMVSTSSEPADTITLLINCVRIKSIIIKQLIIVPFNNDNLPLWSIEKDSAINVLQKRSFVGVESNLNVPVMCANGSSYYNLECNMPVYYRSGFFMNSEGFVAGPIKGQSANRPTSYAAGGILTEANDIGYRYFDTDLGKPIWVKSISGNSVTWVDATGQTV